MKIPLTPEDLKMKAEQIRRDYDQNREFQIMNANTRTALMVIRWEKLKEWLNEYPSASHFRNRTLRKMKELEE